MSEPASISSGIASRYATAVFSLAKEDKKLKPLEADVDALDGALIGSADLRTLVSSPVYSRAEMGQAISAVAKKMKLQPIMVNTLKAQLGLDVKIKATVDESLIGGLVVKVGSKMIDTSIRSKLNALQNKMKEVG